MPRKIMTNIPQGEDHKENGIMLRSRALSIVFMKIRSISVHMCCIWYISFGTRHMCAFGSADSGFQSAREKAHSVCRLRRSGDKINTAETSIGVGSAESSTVVILYVFSMPGLDFFSY